MMQLLRMLSIGRAALVLFALAACAPPAQAVDWQDCPGSVALGPAPPELAQCVAGAGADAADTIQFSIADSFADVQANSSVSMGSRLDASGVFFTDTPVDIQWRDEERDFQFENVGGTGQAVLLMNFIDSARLHSVEFAWQNRPLTLRETIERARRLQASLEEAGYRPPPSGHAFSVLHDSRLTAEAFPDWAAAEAGLIDDGRNIEEIALYVEASATTTVSVLAKNMRRAALNFQDRGSGAPIPGVRRTIFDGNGGYEWLLTVRISRIGPPVN